MKPIAMMLRAVAVLMLPFILFQLIGPFGDFFDWLAKALDPNVRMNQPTGAERLFHASRQITIGLAFLAIPPLLWLAADVAARRRGR